MYSHNCLGVNPDNTLDVREGTCHDFDARNSPEKLMAGCDPAALLNLEIVEPDGMIVEVGDKTRVMLVGEVPAFFAHSLADQPLAVMTSRIQTRTARRAASSSFMGMAPTTAAGVTLRRWCNMALPFSPNVQISSTDAAVCKRISCTNAPRRASALARMQQISIST
jgi:hypothetical protein